MSQSERERALRAAGDALAKYCDYLIEGAGAGGYPHMKERIDAWHAAALDTPQEPTPAAPPAWDRRDQSKVSDFERWWMRESTSSPLGDALDQVDIHMQALIVAFCNSAWLAAAPRSALREVLTETLAALDEKRGMYTPGSAHYDAFREAGNIVLEIKEQALAAPAPREGA